MKNETPTITAYDRKDFRRWLQKHHATEQNVIVLLHKRHTGKRAPVHRELLEEAICFGWIDTTLRRIDDDVYARKFVRRKESGNWSENTLRYARDLIKRGVMTPTGLRMYKLGKAKPTHDHGLPTNPDMPADLKSALAKNVKANKSFAAYPPSAKRTLYRWILRAKLSATRTKRITHIVKNAVKGIKLF
ncbi:MAG: YdeI/OmpD-associated family protein [Patescibacteria group bacterium]